MLMGSAAHADCRTDVSGCYNSVRWWLLQGKTTIGSWERFSLAKLTKLTEVILQQVTTANRERERERERRKKIVEEEEENRGLVERRASPWLSKTRGHLNMSSCMMMIKCLPPQIPCVVATIVLSWSQPPREPEHRSTGSLESTTS